MKRCTVRVARQLLRCVLGLTILSSSGFAADGSDEPLLRRFVERLDRSMVSRCLTPAAGTAMSELVGSGALQPVLGSYFVLKRGNVGGDHIEIEIEDHTHATYGLTLALPGTKTGEPAGRGARFWYYLAPTNAPDPRAAEALLALAQRFDAAIPEAALAPCAGAGPSREEPRYPRALALGSAWLGVMVLLGTIVYGVRALALGLRE